MPVPRFGRPGARENLMSKTKKYDQTESKKQAVLKEDKKTKSLPLILFAAVAVIAGGAYFLLLGDSAGPSAAGLGSVPAAVNTASQAKARPAVAPAKAAVEQPTGPRLEDGRLIIPARIFDDGRAKHFKFKTGDLTIRFFALRSSDGVIRAAFDACDVCWPANKGYHQDGDVMVCANCGRRFASTKINVVQGGCNPAPLRRTEEDGNVIIQAADIEQGRRFFDFS